MNLEVAGLSDDELIVALTSWAGRVAAGEALVLQLLGELDAREAWAQWGMLSCAHWASWRLRLTLPTAREKVRVARCLRDLPLLTAQLRAGQVSYAQARAITRVATAADEQRWVELARFTTAAQLEKATRGVGRARQQPEPHQVQPEAVRLGWDTDGTLLLNLRISPAQAPGVLAALDSAQQAEQSDRDALYAELATDLATQIAPRDASAETDACAEPDVSAEASNPPPPYAEPYEYVEPPYPLSFSRPDPFAPHRPEELAADADWRADRDRRRALRDAARAWEDHLQAQAEAAQLPAPRVNLADALIRALTRPAGLKPVTVKLLIDPATGWARTRTDELLPPTTLAQVLTTLPGRHKPLRARPLTPTDLRRHDLGRDNRHLSPALRELLGQLDGERCRFPSCDRTTNLHAHHVMFWSAGRTHRPEQPGPGLRPAPHADPHRRLPAGPEPGPHPDRPDRPGHPGAPSPGTTTAAGPGPRPERRALHQRLARRPVRPRLRRHGHDPTQQLTLPRKRPHLLRRPAEASRLLI